MKNKIKLSLVLRFSILICCIVAFSIILFPVKNFMQIINTFAYFTNQSNLLVLITVSILLIKTLCKIKSDKNYIATINKSFHLFVLFTITVTMMVYTGLLLFVIFTNSLEIINFTGMHFVSEILFHFVIPILFIIDFHFFSSNEKIEYSKANNFCFYIIVYFLMLVIRAESHTLLHDVESIGYKSYYPYPFIDINKLGMVGSFISVVVCLSCFYLYSLFLIKVNNVMINTKNNENKHSKLKPKH